MTECGVGVVGDGAQSVEDCPLLVLTFPLSLQGRAGADGARGMPGEPGVKVTGWAFL